MIKQELYLNRYDWNIIIYYNVMPYNTASIIKSLENLGCSYKQLRIAYDNISSYFYNTGLCYSSYDDRTSLICINKSDSAKEFLNTTIHELFHATIHICKYYNIDTNSEEAAYLIGNIVKKCYNNIKKFL